MMALKHCMAQQKIAGLKHLAITTAGGTPEWLEAVAEEDYQQLQK